MNKKGQALVEFVIILPILLLILMSILDIGRIIINKNRLEDELYDVVKFYEDNYTYEEIKKEIDKDTDIKITNNDGKEIIISLNKKMELITPGLNILLDNPYVIEAKKVISYE